MSLKELAKTWKNKATTATGAEGAGVEDDDEWIKRG
jgi:hypothetical protein